MGTISFYGHHTLPFTLTAGFLAMAHIATVRDRLRTKMERDILVEVRHPFIVQMEYGMGIAISASFSFLLEFGVWVGCFEL